MQLKTINSQNDILEIVQEIGFLPFFENEIEGFSIEEISHHSIGLTAKRTDIDLGRRIIHIRNTRTTAVKEIYQTTTKNESSTRDLPIDDFLMKLEDKQEADKKFFGKGYVDCEFLCRWDDGTAIKLSYVSKAFQTLLEKAGMPKIRFHDIRHSTATNLLAKGVDLKIIQEYVGHSTISTTANLYLHPDIEEKKKAVNAISSIFSLQKSSGKSSGKIDEVKTA